MSATSIIWANMLVAQIKTWSQVPSSRKEEVKLELQNRVKSGDISEEFMKSIIK